MHASRRSSTTLRRAGAADTVQVLLVADPEKLQIGLVSAGSALAFAGDDPLLADLRRSAGEVKHTALAKGHLLAITAKA